MSLQRHDTSVKTWFTPVENQSNRAEAGNTVSGYAPSMRAAAKAKLEN